MSGYTWIVFQCENKSGKWACYKRIRNTENLLDYARIENVVSMCAVKTEKSAK